MLTSVRTGTKLRQGYALFLYSIPLAVGVILIQQALQLDWLDLLTVCGIIAAVAGGCTKIGSA